MYIIIWWSCRRDAFLLIDAHTILLPFKDTLLWTLLLDDLVMLLPFKDTLYKDTDIFYLYIEIMSSCCLSETLYCEHYYLMINLSSIIMLLSKYKFTRTLNIDDSVNLLPFKDTLLWTLLLDDPIILLPFKDPLLWTLLLNDLVILMFF